ncbi:MAG: MFS transporter [Gammaproteobacteria bacterium]
MSEQPKKFGPIVLAEGVRPKHAAFYLYSCFIGVTLTTFISVIQPYILNVNLALPVEQQGQVSGDMVFLGEIVLLTLSALVGVLSDRIGRRGVFVAGAMILGLGYIFYGYVDSVGSLAAVRIFLAFGIVVVNVMIATLQVDYPAEESRGKLVATAGVCIGLGAVLIGVFYSRLPYMFVGAGADELDAGRYTMFFMAALAISLGVLLQIGLKGGKPVRAKEREPFISQLAKGLSVARTNSKIALAYGCAFVARADLVVVGTFYTLWLNQAGIAEGMSPEDAARVAGGLFGMVMLAALVWAPVMGWLNDRMDRVHAMALAMLLAAIGYSCMALIPDPLGVWMYPGGILLGIGQMSAVTASQTLIGQEAPEGYRGSVVGMFSVFGAAGILFVTSIGGRMFDAIGATAPFLLIGAANAVLFVAAMLIAKTSTAGSS